MYATFYNAKAIYEVCEQREKGEGEEKRGRERKREKAYVKLVCEGAAWVCACVCVLVCVCGSQHMKNEKSQLWKTEGNGKWATAHGTLGALYS